MVQQSTTWDLQHVLREPPNSMKTYALFVFVVCIVGSVKLVRVWRVAPPFRLSRQAGSLAYSQLLETLGASLKQWIALTFLVWGFLGSINLYDVCNRLLQAKRITNFEILVSIQDFSKTLTMALLATLFLFLVRWHTLARIERVRHLHNEHGPEQVGSR
jgi:hypothetical protein